MWNGKNGPHYQNRGFQICMCTVGRYVPAYIHLFDLARAYVLTLISIILFLVFIGPVSFLLKSTWQFKYQEYHILINNFKYQEYHERF